MFDSPELLPKIVNLRKFIAKYVFLPTLCTYMSFFSFFFLDVEKVLRILGVIQLFSVSIKIKAQRLSFSYPLCHLHMDY